MSIPHERAEWEFPHLKEAIMFPVGNLSPCIKPIFHASKSRLLIDARKVKAGLHGQMGKRRLRISGR
jgi:hypothetical protein